MILCMCRGVSDRTVRALIAAGAQTRDEVQEACGAGSDCGQCWADLADLLENIRETRYENQMATPSVPERVLT